MAAQNKYRGSPTLVCLIAGNKNSGKTRWLNVVSDPPAPITGTIGLDFKHVTLSVKQPGTDSLFGLKLQIWDSAVDSILRFNMTSSLVRHCPHLMLYVCDMEDPAGLEGVLPSIVSKVEAALAEEEAKGRGRAEGRHLKAPVPAHRVLLCIKGHREHGDEGPPAPATQTTPAVAATPSTAAAGATEAAQEGKAEGAASAAAAEEGSAATAAGSRPLLTEEQVQAFAATHSMQACFVQLGSGSRERCLLQLQEMAATTVEKMVAAGFTPEGYGKVAAGGGGGASTGTGAAGTGEEKKEGPGCCVQ